MKVREVKKPKKTTPTKAPTKATTTTKVPAKVTTTTKAPTKATTTTTKAPTKATTAKAIVKPIRKKKRAYNTGPTLGEIAMEKAARELGWESFPQYGLSTLPRKRYDLLVRRDGRELLLEFDGKQHFQYVRRFKSSKLKDTHERDREKTHHALKQGYRMGRVDYLYNEDEMKLHLTRAMNCRKGECYLSSPEMYKFLKLKRESDNVFKLP